MKKWNCSITVFFCAELLGISLIYNSASAVSVVEDT